MKRTMIIDGVKYDVKEPAMEWHCTGCSFYIKEKCVLDNKYAFEYCNNNNCVYKKVKQTSAPKKKDSNPTKSTPTPSELHGIKCEDTVKKMFEEGDKFDNQSIASVLDSIPIEAIFDHLRSKGYTGTICKTEKIEL